jgi:hypothetical protein
MKTKVDLVLINGIFTPDDAKEVLMNIFASKIQFHELKNLRAMVLNDSEDQTSLLRVQQLKKTIEEFNVIFNKAIENNSELSIKSHIEITLRKSD